MPDWLPLAILLANTAILIWVRLPLVEIPVIIAVGGVFAALVLPLVYVNTFVIAAFLSYLVSVMVWRRLPAHRDPAARRSHVGFLMEDLAQLYVAHHHKWISDDQFRREYAKAMAAFEQEDCEVVVNIEPQEDDEIEVHVLVHKRHE